MSFEMLHLIQIAISCYKWKIYLHWTNECQWCHSTNTYRYKFFTNILLVGFLEDDEYNFNKMSRTYIRTVEYNMINFMIFWKYHDLRVGPRYHADDKYGFT